MSLRLSWNGDQPERKINRVAAFAGSSFGKDPIHKAETEKLSRYLGETGRQIYFGAGSKGLMGVLAKTALDAGGEVVGVSLPHFTGEIELTSYRTYQYIVAQNVFERKQVMIENSDAAIAFPGGFGTLDEITDAGVEQYLGAYSNPPVKAKPIILLNTNGIYDYIPAALKKKIEEGFCNPGITDMFTMVDNAQQGIDAILRFEAQGFIQLPKIGNTEDNRPIGIAEPPERRIH